MRFDAGTSLVLAWDKKAGRFADKTADIVALDFDGQQYSVRYRGARYPFKYNCENLVACEATSADDIGDALVEVRGVGWPAATRLEVFATPVGSWTRVHYATSRGASFRTYPSAEVRYVANARQQPRLSHLMSYFDQVVDAHPEDDPLRRAFARLKYLHPDSALATYLTGVPPAADRTHGTLVFPFSSNLSQREAIDMALSHPISVIEGPPGTGKTETILNLIANIVRNPSATVGVVSFSNAAVDNVYDKLQRKGFGFIAAPLGSRERRDAFLDGQNARNAVLADFLAQPVPPEDQASTIEALGAAVHDVYALERDAAQLRATLHAIEAEQAAFTARFPVATAPRLPEAAERWDSDTLLSLLAEIELAQYAQSRVSRWRWALRRRRRYRLDATVDVTDPAFAVEVQRRYYRVRRDELVDAVARCDARLADPAVDSVRRGLTDASMRVWSGELRERYTSRPEAIHTPQSLWRDRDGFAQDYPVLLSTCHSLPNAVGEGRLLDYVIIDEASQVNLATAVLALSVARRVIVVGDVRQLPNIAMDIGGLGLQEDLAPYDYTRHSILSSLFALYGDALPRTLLREHYRCDPRIIDFCNRMYYGGRLIPMTQEHGGPALAVLRTAPGHHSRMHSGGGHTNEREVDVIEREAIPTFCANLEHRDIGVVTPFRRQADLVAARLPGVEADTVHKFQGREKAAIVLSTLIDESHGETRLAPFVDDPRMINVAVSRAQDRLVVVANPDLPDECTNLHYLIDYIERRSPDHVVRSDIVSVFDVLYTEYADTLRLFASKLRGRTPYRSEEAVLVMLEELLRGEAFHRLQLSYQVLMHHLVPRDVGLSPDEAAFVRNRSSVDFVVSDRVSGQVLGVIEVDGFAYHQDSPEQLRRDALKDAILGRSGIALLRLATTGSQERERTEEFLRSLAKDSILRM